MKIKNTKGGDTACRLLMRLRQKRVRIVAESRTQSGGGGINQIPTDQSNRRIILTSCQTKYTDREIFYFSNFHKPKRAQNT
jgi:hypothetical protein